MARIVKIWEDRISKGLCKFCGKNPPDKNLPLRGRRSKDGISHICIDCKKKNYEKYKHKPYMSKERQRAYRREILKQVFEKYGGKCECCGEDAWEYLSIDHINGDGGKERKNYVGCYSPHKFYLKLKREPKRDDLRVLCMNCNTSISKFGYSPKCNCS